MKIVLFSLVAVFLLVEAHDDAFKRYATMKIFEDCYGRDTVRQWYTDMKTAHDKCMGQTESTANAFMYMMGLFRRYHQRVQMQQQQQQQQFIMQRFVSQSQGFPMFGQEQKRPFMPIEYEAPQYYPARMSPPRREYFAQPTYHQEMFYRGKRAAEDKTMTKPVVAATKKAEEVPAAPMTEAPMTEAPMTAMPEKMAAQMESIPLPIRQMFEQLQYHVSNMTCVMKELEFIGEDNQVHYDKVKGKITAMQISEEVKEDLYHGMERCRQISMCLPEEEHADLMKDLNQPMAFFKCFKGKKLEACMKKDLRERFGEFFDDEMMMMSRQFMGDEDKKPYASRDNMFDMLYGFDVKEMKHFL